MLERVAEFSKHHANGALKAFLDVNAIMASNRTAAGDMTADDDFNDGTGGGGGAPARRGSTRPTGNSRRGSLQSKRKGESPNRVRPSTATSASPSSGDGRAAEKAVAAPAKKELEVPEEYSKFVKMLKMHIPRGAVDMKMTAEGLSPSDLDQYLTEDDGGFGGGSGGGAPAAAPPPAARKAEPPPAPPPKGTKPPKASGGRAALFADIAKRRID